MRKLVFVTGINKTEQTGIADVYKTPPELFCLCNEDNAKEILSALEFYEKNKLKYIHPLEWIF